LKRLRTFGLKLEVVFCDTTSTYFEGKGPESLAKKGFSRDNHPENSQVVIGVLMRDEGIRCEVYPGNFHNAKTLRTALYDLSRRFKIRRNILCADRGMVSEKNLSLNFAAIIYPALHYY